MAKANGHDLPFLVAGGGIGGLVTAYALAHNPKPDRSQIIEHMSTNICRCGSYQRVVRAVERAAKEA